MDELYHYGVKGMHWGVRRYQNEDGSLTNAGKKHRNDETSSRKNITNNLKKGAVITAGALAVYGTHKVLNSPSTINTGKAFIDNVLKTSNALSNVVTSSTEYKMAKAVVGGAKSVGKGVGKAGNTIFNDKTVKAITGIGAMATTAQLLRTQIKDLKDIRSQHDDDAVNKTLNEIKKMSEIGESASKLAKGPTGQSGYQSNNSKTDSNLLVKTRNLKSEIGEPQGMRGAEDEKRYQALFKKNPTDDQRAWIKAMRKNGYSVDQIEQYIFHSGYFGDELYHYGVLGMRWGVRHDKDKSGRHSTSSDDSNSSKSRGLSDKQKKAIKYGALAVGTGIAIYGAYKAGSVEQPNDNGRVIDFNKYADRTPMSQMKFDYNTGRFEVPDITGMTSIPIHNRTLSDEDIKKCASKMNSGNSKSNCGSTSTATIANIMEGYNKYEALPETPEHMRKKGGVGYDPDKLIDCYEGGKWDVVMDSLTRKEHSEKIINKLTSYGEGAKGIMYPEQMVGRSTSHYYSWMIKNGKPIVIETQPESAQSECIIYKNFADDVGRLCHSNYDVRIARLDNCRIKPGREKDLFRKR